jgi:hypothetical protein
MHKTILSLLVVLQFIVLTCVGQEVLYFDKLSQLVSNQTSYSRLYKQIDSLKQTRRPNDSHLTTYLNRDIDFGYTHTRLKVTLNNMFYLVNVVLKQDTIVFSHTSFDDFYYSNIFKKYKKIKLDTVACQQYLLLRNKFYKSSKTLNSIKLEIPLNDDFAFYCGDGLPETPNGKYIKSLAKRKDVKKLTDLLNSINCEQQEFGKAGLLMIESGGYELPLKTKQLINYIKKRNSEVSTCSGCFAGVVKKLNNN